jgi:hypothetical protein
VWIDVQVESWKEDSRSTLDELAREGARRMIAAALEVEVDEYVRRFAESRDEEGRAGRPERSWQGARRNDGCRHRAVAGASHERQARRGRRTATVHQQDPPCAGYFVDPRIKMRVILAALQQLVGGEPGCRVMTRGMTHP